MIQKRIMWLEDEFEDLGDFLQPMYQAGYLVEEVESVTKAVDCLLQKDYFAVIFDIKVHPGDSLDWLALDKKKRSAKPGFDSYLGLELMRSIYNSKKAEVVLEPEIVLNPKTVIVFSVVADSEVIEEISNWGIPLHQIAQKSSSSFTTLVEILDGIDL